MTILNKEKLEAITKTMIANAALAASKSTFIAAASMFLKTNDTPKLKAFWLKQSFRSFQQIYAEAVQSVEPNPLYLASLRDFAREELIATRDKMRTNNSSAQATLLLSDCRFDQHNALQQAIIASPTHAENRQQTPATSIGRNPNATFNTAERHKLALNTTTTAISRQPLGTIRVQNSAAELSGNRH